MIPLFFQTITLFIVSFVLFVIGSGVSAWVEYPNKENVFIERVLFCMLALTHVWISVFVISKRRKLSGIYISINTIFVIALYLIAGYIWLTN
jgi:hypothetical protein